MRKPIVSEIAAGLVLAGLFALGLPALAQTMPGRILTSPETPRTPPPANPSGVPPLPTIIPPAILTPGSGH